MHFVIVQTFFFLYSLSTVDAVFCINRIKRHVFIFMYSLPSQYKIHIKPFTLHKARLCCFHRLNSFTFYLPTVLSHLMNWFWMFPYSTCVHVEWGSASRSVSSASACVDLTLVSSNSGVSVLNLKKMRMIEPLTNEMHQGWSQDGGGVCLNRKIYIYVCLLHVSQGQVQMSS